MIKEDSKEENIKEYTAVYCGIPKEKINYWLKQSLLFILVIAIGLLAINQALGFFYKTQFLATPCNLCGQLNPEVDACIKKLNSPRASFYAGGEGTDGWTDPFKPNRIIINGEEVEIKINLSDLITP